MSSDDAACLQRGQSKILNGFPGFAYTKNQRSFRFSNVPTFYRIKLLVCDLYPASERTRKESFAALAVI
jgi:hypothetical protein